MSKEKKPLPLVVRVLLGVVVAGVMLVAGFVLLSVLVMYWAFSTGAQVDTLGVVAEDSVAVVHLTDVADDPGVHAMVDQSLLALMVASQRVETGTVPPELEQLGRPGGPPMWPMSMMMRLYIPRDATLVFDADPSVDSGLTAGGAANPRSMVRLIRTMLEEVHAGEGADPRIREGDKVFIRLDPDGYVSFDGGTVFWGGLEQLRQLRARVGSDAKPVLVEDVRALRADWPLVGVTRQRDALADLLKLEATAQELAPAGDDISMEAVTFERAWFGVRVPDGDTVELHAVIEGASPAGTELLEHVLKAACEELTAELTPEAPAPVMQMTCTTGAEGADLVLDARVSNIQAALAASIEQSLREQNERQALERENNGL